MLRPRAVVLLALAALCPVADAAAQTAGLQVVAHEARSTSAVGYGPAPLAALPGGRLLVAFEARPRLSGPGVVQVRAIGPGGRPEGRARTVSPPEQTRGAFSAGLATGGAAGGALAFWVAPDGTNLQAHVRRVGPDGQPVGATLQLRSPDGAPTTAPAAAFDPSGGGSFLVAFTGSGKPARVVVQRVALDGKAAGAPVIAAEGEVATPSIAVRPDGGALVTWLQRTGEQGEVLGRLLAPGSAAPEGGPVQLTTTAPPRRGSERTDFGTGAVDQTVAWDGARWLVAWSRLTGATDACEDLDGAETTCDALYGLTMEGRVRAVGPALEPGGPEVVALPQAAATDNVVHPVLAVGPGEVMVTWPGNRVTQATLDLATLARRSTFTLAQVQTFVGEPPYAAGAAYLPESDTYSVAYLAGERVLLRRFGRGSAEVDDAAPRLVVRPTRARVKRRMTLRVRCAGEPCPVLRLRSLSLCRDSVCGVEIARRVKHSVRRTARTELRISLRLSARQLRAARRGRALLVVTANAADFTGNDTAYVVGGDPGLLVRLRR